MSIKLPETKIVGFERPGLAFPESAQEFFDFLLKRVGERVIYHAATPALLESVKMEIAQLLHLANDIYRLGCGHDFWDVTVGFDDETRAAKLEFRPRSIPHYFPIEISEHEQGGFVAKTSKLYVRADSPLEALAALGRLAEVRRLDPDKDRAELVKQIEAAPTWPEGRDPADKELP